MYIIGVTKSFSGTIAIAQPTEIIVPEKKPTFSPTSVLIEELFSLGIYSSSFYPF